MTLASEVRRKAFHMLSLAFLAAYHWIGYPRVLVPAAGWMLLVCIVEAARLKRPDLNRRLMAPFDAIPRAEEARRVSGIFHTSAGCLLVMLFFGDRPALVSAAILCLALGDAAAALAGRLWGRHKIMAGRKSLEGSAACWTVSLFCALWTGFPAGPCAAAATAATLIELLPNNEWSNDNLWMPVAFAAALYHLA
ncbi:MAG: hypothetical protein HY549_13445 [Elusimicrobia bacterium]|nr:hypothetical protein [Elusimicrobiota bacterium]